MKSLYFITSVLFLYSSLNGQSFVNGPFTNKFIGQPKVADFNGDEKIDVVGVSKFLSLEGDLQLHVNVSEAGSISFETTDLQLEVLGNPGNGDFDSDGDMDLVVTRKADSLVVILLNDGNGAFQINPQNSETAYEFTIADLDKDLDPDIISYNEYNRKSYYMINNGDGVFQTLDLITNDDDLEVLIAGDIDEDNDIDIIAGFDNFFDARISILRNNGNAVFTQQLITNEAIGGLENLQMVDIDKDGDEDIAYSSNDISSLRILINNGGQVFTEMSLASGEGRIRSFNITDYNTDGILDILIGCNSDDATYHQGQSAGPFIFSSEVITSIQPLWYIVNGDLDGDDDLDAVLSNGDFWWIRNDLEQFHVSTTEIKTSPYSIFPNPFNSFIDVNLRIEDKEVVISDFCGKIIIRTQGNNFPLDLEILNKGVYFLSIIDQKSGTVIQSSRIVKIE